MDLKKCLDNLRHDLNNGGVEDDSFAMNCYVTIANEAHRLIECDTSDERTRKVANEYLAMCRSSGSDILRYVAA